MSLELNKLLSFKKEIEARGGSLTKSQKARLLDLLFNEDKVQKANSTDGTS